MNYRFAIEVYRPLFETVSITDKFNTFLSKFNGQDIVKTETHYDDSNGTVYLSVIYKEY